MTHLLFFAGGLGLTIYGVIVNTKSNIQLRKQLIIKYTLIYLTSVALFKFLIIPIFSFIKH